MPAETLHPFDEGSMSRTPTPPTWFPDAVIDAERVLVLSHALTTAAREARYSRNTFAAAVAQMAEALVGVSAEDDIDGEVLRFVGERLRATADAIDGSAN